MTLSNEKYQLVRERSEQEVAQFTIELAKVYQARTDKTACYLYGMGGQTASFYHSLKAKYGKNLLWTGSVLPKVIGMVLRFIPTYAGILRIHSGDELISLFPLLTEQSMAAVYLFALDKDEEMEKIAMQRPKELQFIVEADPSHFIYVVDEDSGSTDKIIEMIKWGEECPLPLRNLIQ